MSTPLPILDDHDYERILCIVAHPDDLEYGASAAVSHWVRRGKHVAYLLFTSGEAGMQAAPEEVGPLRAVEQRHACAAVGVNDLTILDFPDGQLIYGLELRRAVARAVRQFTPTAVLTTNFDVVAPYGLNQADHRAAGLAVVDGVRDAGNRWVFTDLLDEGLEPWQVSDLLVAAPSHPTHAVLIDERGIADAIASLTCHAAYLADLPNHPAPAEFLPEVLAAGGALADAPAALPVTRFALTGD